MVMTLQDRVEAYKAAFPQYPDSWPWVTPTGRWLNAVWLGGENYKGSGYYGAYPPWYLPRLAALFPDIPQEEWLHLYAGSLTDATPGWKLELRPPGDGVAPAHVRADARHLPFLRGCFRFTAADPPYTELDAERYHTPAGLNKPAVVRDVATVTHAGGFLAWLDTTLPIYHGETWQHFGMILVQRSCNHRTRLCSLFARR
jgi:hypothetical protein